MTVRTPALDRRGCRLLNVTARLQSGVVLPTWYPAPLDGILAAAARRRRLGGSYGSTVDHHTEPLPLAAIRDGLGARWVWAATCATPAAGAGEDVRWWHQRFDDQQAAEAVDRLPASTDTGRYKPYRMPLVVTVTTTLRWTAVGDRDAVADLLGDVVQVGKKRSQGEGLVLHWTVDDAGPGDLDAVLWADDGHPARPFPARAADPLGVEAPDTVPMTYRPPYWRGAHDGPGRAWQEVIAPWTSRPSASMVA